jgi:hypothetical protein
VLGNKIKRVQARMDARGHHFQQHLQVHSDFPNTLYLYIHTQTLYSGRSNESFSSTKPLEHQWGSPGLLFNVSFPGSKTKCPGSEVDSSPPSIADAQSLCCTSISHTGM